MRYEDYIRQQRVAPKELPFMKLAEQREKKAPRSALKDLALVGAGTATGAGAAYGGHALIRSLYADALEGVPPSSKLKVLIPAAAATGGLAALTHVLRQRADDKRD
jgi:hypothetical protein